MKIRLCIQYSELSSGKVLELSLEDRKYLFNVLRCLPGTKIFVTDGKGQAFLAKILNKKHIEIIETVETCTEEDFSLILCQGLLKGEKMDMVVQKATELGVKKIIPFVSERSVVKNTKKISRWQKIAKEAAEQSGRTVVPEIAEVINFYDLINETKAGILFWEKETASLLEVLSHFNKKTQIFLFIGPEGGFSLQEVKEAEKKGIFIASLGKRILRAETASIASISIVSFLLQNYPYFSSNF